MAVCDPQTLKVLSAWQLPAQSAAHDGDWSTTPTVFKDAHGRTLVAAGAKDGLFRAFDSNRIGDGPIWQFRVADEGECPLCGEGTISSSAYAYGRLYVAGGHITINGERLDWGTASALDPSTGQVIWRFGTPGGIFGSVCRQSPGRYSSRPGYIAPERRHRATIVEVPCPEQDICRSHYCRRVLYVADMGGTLYAFSAGPYPDPTATPQPPAQPAATSTPVAAPVQTPKPAPPLPGESRCFQETGKCLRGTFLDYWQQNGRTFAVRLPGHE